MEKELNELFASRCVFPLGKSATKLMLVVGWKRENPYMLSCQSKDDVYIGSNYYFP